MVMIDGAERLITLLIIRFRLQSLLVNLTWLELKRSFSVLVYGMSQKLTQPHGLTQLVPCAMPAPSE